jgi:enoyl-CoA hydratase
MEPKMTSRYSSYQKLTFERPAPKVLEIVLNGVGRGNACDAQLHAEMAVIWKDVEADPEINAAIVRGRDDAFCAGGHMDLVEDLGQVPFLDLLTSWKEARGIVYNMLNCPKPIVSAIRGQAAGAGLACAMLADIIIAAKTARINDAHIKLGMVAGDHAAIIWPLLCGMAKAKYHLLLNDMISGEEAERIGLVSLCVEDDQTYDKAREVAARLASGAQTAIRWTKLVLNNWLRQAGPTFDTSLAFSTMSFLGPDVKEGIAAMREKRKPNFTASSPL